MKITRGLVLYAVAVMASDEIPTNDGVVAVLLEQDSLIVRTNIHIGTPPQKVSCILDTGSSDFLVASTNFSRLNDWEYFNENKSTTFNGNISSLPQLQINTGSWSLVGNWASDTVVIGGSNATLPQTTMGLVGTGSKLDIACVIGLGPVNGEITGTSVENGVVSPTYDNILIRLRNQQQINSLTYSMWSNNATAAVLLFGGVNHARYEGSLGMVPIVGYVIGEEQVGTIGTESYPMVTRIMVHSVKLTFPSDHVHNSTGTASIPPASGPLAKSTGPVRSLPHLNQVGSDETRATNHTNTTSHDDLGSTSISYSFSVPVTVGSSAYVSLLPQDIVNGIAKAYNMPWGRSFYYSKCNIPGTLSFNFSGIEVSSPITDYLVSPSEVDQKPIRFSDGTEACIFSFYPTTGPTYTFGNSVLRNMYMVVDLDHMQLGIAPVNQTLTINHSDFQIEALSTGIPNATEAPLYSSTKIINNVESYQIGKLPSFPSLTVVNGVRGKSLPTSALLFFVVVHMINYLLL